MATFESGILSARWINYADAILEGGEKEISSNRDTMITLLCA